MAKEDGNIQEFSVHDKDNAALIATREAQDMSRLDRLVVPMPAFVNPNNPDTSAGSINMPLDAHPVEHAPEYGEGYGAPTDSPMGGDPPQYEEGDKTGEKSRDEWSKEDYKTHLTNLGLPVSGNKEALIARLDEWEAQEKEYKSYTAEQWKEDIAAAGTKDDLTELRDAYERSEADYVTVDEAFAERESEVE